jgi:hypothetical protein
MRHSAFYELNGMKIEIVIEGRGIPSSLDWIVFEHPRTKEEIGVTGIEAWISDCPTPLATIVVRARVERSWPPPSNLQHKKTK